MNRSIDHISIFKTNIKTEKDVTAISSLMLSEPRIIEWSIDTEDVDCVLRIVSELLAPEHVIELITKQGFICLEM